MGLFQGNIYSEALGMYTSLFVYLPQDEPNTRFKNKPSTLILLHGLTGNSASWSRRTNLDAIVNKYNIAVFMPEVSRSFYHDLNPGLKYFKYVSEELPEIIAKTYNVLTDRDNLYIAGLSMGAYGAMKCALTYPEKFSHVGGFSGMYHIKNYIDRFKNDLNNENVLRAREDFYAIFGKGLEKVETGDLHKLFLDKFNKTLLPKMYLSCGISDPLLPLTQDFHKLLDKQGFNHVYQEFEGSHEWNFWSESLRRMLEVFFDE